ncbi:MAG: hypothetical protein GX181_06390 [Synergistaceae bacterium]|nr:4Fe-4S dicluster domain-containing protein [Synergistota bacterium]NLM71569.1 hypothetical protein [Synergistaceae bacterium]
MEKARLIEFESKCVQDEPPFCQAACPLHLDGRALCGFVQAGRFNDARKLIERALPLPEVLARICDAPCREACRRAKLGGSIELGLIERACVEQGALKRAPLLIPKSGKKVAVLGCGLSSLCAASDGVRKGYSVTVYCDEDPASLLTGLSPVVTDDVASREIAWLRKGGASFLPWSELSPLAELIESFDGAYAGLDDPRAVAVLDDIVSTDSVSLATRVEGLFAGGDSPSFITRAADGRRGMKSVERHMQGASLHSAREKEGPYPTRLFTSTEGVAPVPPVEANGDSFTSEEAVAEAERCLMCECLECVKHCAFMQNYKGYPKKFAREVYNNLSVIQGTRLANTMINSCSLCGRCERICPEGFSMADLVSEARREMIEQEKMPPSAHDFALEDMSFYNSPKAALLRGDPDVARPAYLLYPGCRLSGSSPDATKHLYDFLRKRLDGGVGMWLRCCGAPAEWAGRDDMASAGLDLMMDEWRSMGSPMVIVACTSCLSLFRRKLPEMSTLSLWELLDGMELPESVHVPERVLAVADPCTAAEMPVVRSAVRSILAKSSVRFEEPPLSGELTFCCGFGGLQECANPDLARASAKARGGESEHDFLVYCAMCRNSFVQSGKPAAYLLDILFPGGEDDPAGGVAVSYSDQRENRVALVRSLKRDLWKEDDLMEEHESVIVHLSPEAEALLSERRIMLDTVKRTIRGAERSGKRMRSPDGVLTASLRPASVTYWVTYSPRDDGSYDVHGGWSHRMTVVGAEDEP